MVQKEVLVKTTVCDICGDHEFVRGKCLVCGKDICDDCNAVEGLYYNDRWVILCPEHAKDVKLKDLMQRLEKCSF